MKGIGGGQKKEEQSRYGSEMKRRSIQMKVFEMFQSKQRRDDIVNLFE
jgi:hypothetical protein